MTRTTRRIVAAAGSALAFGTVLALPTASTAAATSHQACVSVLPGPSIYLDGNYHNGFQWKKKSKGYCKGYQANDAWSTSGKSIRIYYGSGVAGKCVNGKKKAVRPANMGVYTTATIQGFPKKGCKS